MTKGFSKKKCDDAIASERKNKKTKMTSRMNQDVTPRNLKIHS